MMTGSITRDDRHRKNNRCPICDGADGDPRGKGVRCSGFTKDDYTQCSRSEFSGALTANDAGLFVHKMSGECRCGVTHNAEIRPLASTHAAAPTEFDYRDESNALLYQVLRFHPKEFRQRKPAGVNTWEWKLGEIRRVPYRLPELLKADPSEPVFIVEGEKDVDCARRLGLVATCNAGGAGKFKSIEEVAKKVLSGRDVIVIPDKDEPGRAHAKDIEARLRGIAKSIRLVQVPGQHKDLSAWVDAAEVTAVEVLRLAQTETRQAPPTIYANDLAGELGPLPWVCEDLRIAPGRPTVFAGEGGSRKSYFAMGLTLAVASEDEKFLGHNVRHGDALHIDSEQGQRLSMERYQSLASGQGIDLASLGKRLAYRWRPQIAWHTASAVDDLCWHSEGFVVCLIDPLRVVNAGIDENSVGASAPLDVATAASEKTGCTFIFIDHAGKPPGDGNTRNRKHAQRGHSSKIDASQTLIVLSASKKEPTLVTCERDQISGRYFDDFKFTLMSNAAGGLRLADVPMPQMQSGEDRLRRLIAAVVDVVRKYATKNGGAGIASVEAIAKLMPEGMRNVSDVRAVVRQAETQRLIGKKEGAYLPCNPT